MLRATVRCCCVTLVNIQHNPLDTQRREKESWRSPLWSGNPLKPKHLLELNKFDTTEWFGEDVSRILIPRDVTYCDCLLLDLFVDPVVSTVHGAHAS